MDYWQIVLEHRPLIRAICKRQLRVLRCANYALDDLQADMELRLYHVLHLYDEDLSTVQTYITTFVQLTARREVTRHLQEYTDHPTIDTTSTSEIEHNKNKNNHAKSGQEGKNLAYYIRELSARQAYVIRGLLDGKTVREIGDELGLCKTYVAVEHEKAIERLRELMRD